MTIKQSLYELVVMLLVLTRSVLKYASGVAIAMGVLWQIGLLYPFVAEALGLPYPTVYSLLSFLFGDVSSLVKAAHVSR